MEDTTSESQLFIGEAMSGRNDGPHNFDPFDRFFIIYMSTISICLVLVVVICVFGDICYLHNIIFTKKNKHQKLKTVKGYTTLEERQRKIQFRKPELNKWGNGGNCFKGDMFTTSCDGDNDEEEGGFDGSYEYSERTSLFSNSKKYVRFGPQTSLGTLETRKSKRNKNVTLLQNKTPTDTLGDYNRGPNGSTSSVVQDSLTISKIKNGNMKINENDESRRSSSASFSQERRPENSRDNIGNTTLEKYMEAGTPRRGVRKSISTESPTSSNSSLTMSLASALSNLSLSLTSAVSFGRNHVEHHHVEEMRHQKEQLNEALSNKSKEEATMTHNSRRESSKDRNKLTGAPPPLLRSTSSISMALSERRSSNTSKVVISFYLRRKQLGMFRARSQSGGSKKKLEDKQSGKSESYTLRTTEMARSNSEEDITNNINFANLCIKIQSVHDLPPRDYSLTRDPFVKFTLVRERRSLRKKSQDVVNEWTTDAIKHSLNPVFNCTFSTKISIKDLKQLRLKVTALDMDRHTKISEIGSTSISLKNVKNLSTSDEPIVVTNYLVHKKKEFGELLLSLTYLPTAQRLSFSIIKASNLKYEEIIDTLEAFRPYVRILQVSSQTGKVIRKMRTTTKIGTRDPDFGETLNFDLAPENLENVVFLILVLQDSHQIVVEQQQSPPPEEPLGDNDVTNRDGEDSSRCLGKGHDEKFLQRNQQKRRSNKQDKCLGMVCLGRKVGGECERSHWTSVMMTPRKPFSVSHKLT